MREQTSTSTSTSSAASTTKISVSAAVALAQKLAAAAVASDLSPSFNDSPKENTQPVRTTSISSSSATATTTHSEGSSTLNSAVAAGGQADSVLSPNNCGATTGNSPSTAAASALFPISLPSNNSSNTTTTNINPSASTTANHDQIIEDLAKSLDGVCSTSDLARDAYINPSSEEFEKIISKLKMRVSEGTNETILDIGVEESGDSMRLTNGEFDCYIHTLRRAADSIGCDLTVIHRRNNLQFGTSSSYKSDDSPSPSPTTTTTTTTSNILPSSTSNTASSSTSNNFTSSNGGTLMEISSNDQLSRHIQHSHHQHQSAVYNYAHVLIRQRGGVVENILELRVAVVGNVDAGKSTLLGVLTKNVLDDGRGKARINLFRHKHEIDSGRTSSVGSEIMGFISNNAQIVTPEFLGKQKLGWEDICSVASKVLTFYDLAGHEKYLKTTVFGMTGCAPDYVMLMIGANAGVIGMTKEHLGLALALNVPVFIVITKIDMCPKNILENTINNLTKILKSSGCRKIPMFINTIDDVLVANSTFVSERVCPIFQVSNVSGQNLDLLKTFLNVLHSNSTGKYDSSNPVEYQITDTFSVPGVGTVVCGTVTSGIVHIGDTLMLGPDNLGQFTSTIVKSIQRKRVNVPCASAGQTATFALKKVKRASIRKGMMMLSKSLNPEAFYEFEAEILVLYHSTTINTRYQTMLHCGGVRQTVRIVAMDKAVLRTGDRAIVRFRFMQRPEYLKAGTRLLFREGRTKGVGKVVRAISEADVLKERSKST